MNPSDAHSHLATLRQLKEMLDAGTLTPQEFEALKQKLVFGAEPTAPAPPVEAAPSILVAPIVPELLPASELLEPEMTVRVAENPDWLAAAAPVLPTSPVPTPLGEASNDERRNPLTLVFIVGGVLLLMALVLYLTLGSKPTDEHLTSTSQTAADSTATTPDIGPQTDQITLPPAAPETIRVAPAVPLVARTATKSYIDSVAAHKLGAHIKAAKTATDSVAVGMKEDTSRVGQP